VSGVSKMQHLDEAVSSLSIKLSVEEIAYLEESYVPHRVLGFD